MDFDSWDARSKDKALRGVEARLERPTKAWYCKLGRTCDGKPHDGYDYRHARRDQWPPPGTNWLVWAMLSGRGAGKTAAGSHWMRKMSEHAPQMRGIGRSAPDIRETMVEGDSGLIRACESANVDYTWEPSRKRFTFENGCKMLFFSAEEPDSLRGPQSAVDWLDEPAHMPLIEDVWHNTMFGLRLPIKGGVKVLLTSTPLPTAWVKGIIAEDTTVVTSASTYANLDNLDPRFAAYILKKYEGTRIGRQELHGELLMDVEGAMWSRDLIEETRVSAAEYPPEAMHRLIVAVDPSGAERKKRDETGVVAVGRIGDDYYVLADRSGHYSPDGWARAAVALRDELGADLIVAEKNYGGSMVKSTLKNVDPNVTVKLVHSRRGKFIRAEPVVGKFEQNRAHIVGHLPKLEDQLTQWVPDSGRDSPDRLDAMVHGITELDGSTGRAGVAVPQGAIIGRGLAIPRHLVGIR